MPPHVTTAAPRPRARLAPNNEKVDPHTLPPPPFTLSQVRNAIPAHCFNRSLPISMAYLARDFALIALCGYAAVALDRAQIVPPMLLWPIYWVVQGVFMTGLWVTAHECGHQSFSPYRFVNDTVGLIAHSMLLVPYHPWRISHGKHHRSTGDVDNDEVFVPPVRSQFNGRKLPIAQLSQFINIVVMLLFGWPTYLIKNVTGPKKYEGQVNDHFNPDSALFSKSQRRDVIVSDVVLAAWIAFVGYCCYEFGLGAVACLYFVPYLWVNHWLVLITYLQHTDTYVPHFRGAEWNWLRGALCTVDRKFGFFLDHFLHHITDTHVCHHIFPLVPHYHAQEATKHLSKFLGDYYLRDDTFFYKALWKSYNNCVFVEDEGSVLMYKNQ